MNVQEAIRSRHSYRGEFKPDPVPRKDLIAMMEAGLSAPSGCNMQTTSLIAIDDPELLSRIHHVIDPPVGETAPAAICVLTKRVNAYRDKCFATQDYAAAIENMLLTAMELGYQSCWYEGHITDDDCIGGRIAEILHVPAEYELVCFLPIGIAAEEIRVSKKKPFYERAWFNGFPEEGESLTRLSLLRSTRNTRDLGGYLTEEGKRTRFHRLYRSDRLGNLSAEDANFLMSKGVATIIDMREEEAFQNYPDVLPMQEYFHYYHFPMVEGAEVPETVEAVPETYMEIACAKHIGSVFRTIAHAQEGVLFHCSAGKDRTGVVSALLLLLCGVEEKTIVEDYMLTGLYLCEAFDDVRRRGPIYDLNIVIPRESYMRDFLMLFHQRFSSIRDYFQWLGLTKEETDQLRNKLISEN